MKRKFNSRLIGAPLENEKTTHVNYTNRRIITGLKSGMIKSCLEGSNSGFNKKILFKFMIQFKGLTCHAHIVTLLWLILTIEMKTNS